MDQWVILAVIAVVGLMLVSVMKTVVANVLRYVLFVGMAAAILKWTNPDVEGFDFLTDVDILQDLAAIGGIGFVTAWLVMTGFFRKSRFGAVLYPLVGFATTFAAWSVWPHFDPIG